MPNFRMLARSPAFFALSVLVVAAAPCGCQSDPPGRPNAPPPQSSTPARGATAAEVAARPPLALQAPPTSPPPNVPLAEQKAFMNSAARTAWAFVSRAATPIGFVGATDAYPYMTVWDLASTLASIYSARELGFITPTQYQKLMDRAFTTMEKMPLYGNVAYNKLYDARTGTMVDRKTERSSVGYGWSALDHGRFLTWLRIIAQNDPTYAARAEKIVGHLDMDRMVRDGYLYGENLDPKDGRAYDYAEGRIGYEQYAAEGFAQWGARADLALSFGANGRPATVNGQTVLADARGGDHLTSEPFIMMGLELGWPAPHWRPLALSLLAAQEARYKQTGVVTMVSEDAVPDPPAYFYYYYVYGDGRPWVVSTPTGETSSSFPRWVSAKAAFAFHALAPSEYTWRVLQTVKYAAAPKRGWTAGVYEGTRRATKSFNVNTAAIVLESALVFQRGGCPLIQKTCPGRD